MHLTFDLVRCRIDITGVLVKIPVKYGVTPERITTSYTHSPESIFRKVDDTPDAATLN
tara:strand:+ start:461 stop:634 length:174 start_codon:yes stop_codon:yes gene_type:complete